MKESDCLVDIDVDERIIFKKMGCEIVNGTYGPRGGPLLTR
jgi:hypothetical protein